MNVTLSAGIFKRVVAAHYFDFQGRAGRREFWNYITIFLGVTLLAAVAIRVFSVPPVRMLLTLWSLACFLPTTGIVIRRLHDVDRSGWWLVTPVVPAFLMLVLFFWFWPVTVLLAATMLGTAGYLLFLCIQPGMTGENLYGPNPEPLPA
jgi:uncharacterized membrane protein YhaH (DUF805 family)